MPDGTLVFETGIDKSGFERDAKGLEESAQSLAGRLAEVLCGQSAAWVKALCGQSAVAEALSANLASASEDAYAKATWAKEAAQAHMDEASEAAGRSRLAADEAFRGLAQGMADAVASMNRRGEAFAAAGGTVQGLIDGLLAKAPGLGAAVSRLEGILSRLGVGAGLGVGVGAGRTGSLAGVPKLATGLSYVPYNEFPALLHEGEAVLTKAQAALWRAGWSEGRAAAPAVPAPAQAAAGGGFSQVNHFHVPVQTPDEFAKTMRLYATYGMEGVI